MFFFKPKPNPFIEEWRIYLELASASKSLKEFCEKIFENLAEDFQAKSIGLWLKAKKDSELNLFHVLGPKPVGTLLSLKEPALQYMQQTGEGISRFSVQNSPKLVDIKDSALKLFTLSHGALLLPVEYQEEFLGVLSLSTEEPLGSKEKLILNFLALQIKFFLNKEEKDFLKQTKQNENQHRQTLLNKIAIAYQKPLQDMLGMIALIRKGERDPEFLTQASSYLSMLQDGMGELEYKTRCYLELEKLRENEKALPFEVIEVSAFLQKMLSAWKPKLESQGLQLQIKLEPSLKIYGVKSQVLKLFECFFVKWATFSGGQEGRVSIRAKQEGSRVGFWFLDSRLHLGEAEEQKLLQALKRAEDFQEDLDIAFNLIKYLVIQHGGYVSLEFRPGEGTEFFFNLPGSPSAIY